MFSPIRNVVSFAENVSLEFVVLDATGVVFVDHLEEGVYILPLDRDLKLGDEVSDFVNSEVTALVQVEVVEDLAEEGGVASGELENAGFDLTEEVGDGLLGDLRVLLLRDLPGGLHHADEVLVGGGAHGQVGVVVSEFLHGNDAVVVALSSIEVVEEILENIVTGLASLKELRVHGDVVDADDVGKDRKSVV